jgi:hypothetical protein
MEPLEIGFIASTMIVVGFIGFILGCLFGLKISADAEKEDQEEWDRAERGFD